MARYMVERTFPDGLNIPTTSEGATACLGVVDHNAEVGVTWVHSYVNDEKTKSFCVYDGPDPGVDPPRGDPQRAPRRHHHPSMPLLRLRLQRGYDQALADEFAAQPLTDSAPLTAADLSHLPDPVRRFIERSGAVGMPRPQNMRVELDAQMWRKPGQAPMAARSLQYNFFGRPARLFLMKARMFGLPVRGAATLYARRGGRPWWCGSRRWRPWPTTAGPELLRRRRDASPCSTTCASAPRARSPIARHRLGAGATTGRPRATLARTGAVPGEPRRCASTSATSFVELRLRRPRRAAGRRDAPRAAAGRRRSRATARSTAGGSRRGARAVYAYPERRLHVRDLRPAVSIAYDLARP